MRVFIVPFYYLLKNDVREHIKSSQRPQQSYYFSVTLRNTQKQSLEPPLRNTHNIAIYFTIQARNHDFQNLPQSLTDISRKTPFVFKGDPGRPRVSIPAKITPISRHQHIKITTRGYCLICRNSEGTQTANKSIIYRTILKLSKGVLKEVLPSSNEEIKGLKRIERKTTV